MNRHSSSLLVSLIFHLFLALAIFLGYKAILSVKDTPIEEKRVKIKLCCLPQLKPVVSNVKEIQKVVKKRKQMV